MICLDLGRSTPQPAATIDIAVDPSGIEALAQVLDRDRAAAQVEAWGHYRWLYARVLRDWEALVALYLDHGVSPIRPATAFSDADLRMVASTG